MYSGLKGVYKARLRAFSLISFFRSPLVPDACRRARRWLLASVLDCAVLFIAFKGAFWPFVMEDLFSRANRARSRIVIGEIAPDKFVSLLWQPTSFEALPGTPFPLNRHGISQTRLIDARSVSPVWNQKRVDVLHSLFPDHFLPSHEYTLTSSRSCYRIISCRALKTLWL